MPHPAALPSSEEEVQEFQPIPGKVKSPSEKKKKKKAWRLQSVLGKARLKEEITDVVIVLKKPGESRRDRLLSA